MWGALSLALALALCSQGASSPNLDSGVGCVSQRFVVGLHGYFDLSKHEGLLLEGADGVPGAAVAAGPCMAVHVLPHGDPWPLSAPSDFSVVQVCMMRGSSGWVGLLLQGWCLGGSQPF